MPTRKGELSSFEIDRRWPHQVTLRSADCRGSNFGYIHYFCKDLSLAPRHHNVMRNDEWHTVFCFANMAHAEKFKDHSSGEDFDPAWRGRGREWWKWKEPKLTIYGRR